MPDQDEEEAEQWLRTFLANGSRPSKEILEQAKECGISAGTLRRAKDSLSVRARACEGRK